MHLLLHCSKVKLNIIVRMGVGKFDLKISFLLCAAG